MRTHRILVSATVLALLVTCGPIRNYRRTTERDLETVVTAIKASRQKNPVSLFEDLRTTLGCVDSTAEIGATRRADCLGKNEQPVTVIALYREDDEPGYTLDVDANGSGDRPGILARKYLGNQQGTTADGQPAWSTAVGVLSVRPDRLRLERSPSGDVHDVMEVASDPSLPSSEEAIERMYAAVERRGGTRGALATPAKLVALMAERGHLPEEACVGDLLLDGQQICIGRALTDTQPPALAQIHATCTARSGHRCDIARVAELLSEVVGNGIQPVLNGVVTRQGDSPFQSTRDRNFAIVSTLQRFEQDPFEFRHLIVARRLVLTPGIEAALEEGARRPPIAADFDEDLARELVKAEEKR